jgi:hypothetical protein
MEFSYIVIPITIVKDKRLTSFDKLLYANIYSLTKQEGYCWATNKYLADLVCESISYVSKSLRKLKEYNYLIVEVDNKKNNNKRRKISINYLVL